MAGSLCTLLWIWVVTIDLVLAEHDDRPRPETKLVTVWQSLFCRSFGKVHSRQSRCSTYSVGNLERAWLSFRDCRPDIGLRNIDHNGSGIGHRGRSRTTFSSRVGTHRTCSPASE